MNAFMNITIRLNSGAAKAEVRAFRNEVLATQQALNRGAAAGAGFGRTMGLSGMERFGKNLQWTGRQIEFNFTLPIALATAAATKFAFDNEAAMTRIRKVYGEVGGDATQLKAEVDALGRSFEILSNSFGVNQAEVIGIGAAWAQAGAAGVALAKATKQTLELMILGEMEAAAATEGLIAIQSAYRLSTDQLADAVAQLNIVENQTSVGLSDLVDVIARAGGVAKTAGLEIRELAGMAAILVPAAGTGAQAGNALRTMISRLMAPTREATDLLREMGIAIDDASWHSSSAIQRLNLIAAEYKDMAQGQRLIVDAAIASNWQINRFDLLMSDLILNLDEATRSQSIFARTMDITADSTVYNKQKTDELIAVLSSSPRAFKIFVTQMQNALAKAILPMIPALIGVMSTIASAMQWFSRLSDSTRSIVVAFLLLLALVGPIARYIGSFTLLFTILGKAMLGLIDITFGLTSAQAAHFTASELDNMSMVRKHGLIGALIIKVGNLANALLAVPFRIVALAGDLLWKSMVIGAQAAWVAMRLLFSGAIALSGPLFGVFQRVVGSFGTLTSSALSAVGQVATGTARLVASGASAVATVVFGVMSQIAGGISIAASYANAILARSLTGATTIAAKAMAALKTVYAVGAMAMQQVWAAAGQAMVAVWRGVNTAWLVISYGFQKAWLAITTAVQTAWSIMTYSMPVFWQTAHMLMQTTLVGFAKFFGTAWGTIVRLQMAAGRAMVAASIATTGLISRAFVMMASLVMNPFAAISKAWTATVVGMKTVWAGFLTFLSGGWVTVIAGVIIAIGVLSYAFRDKLAGLGQFVVDQFNKLPQGIQNALIAVARMLQSWAEQVAEWLSYLNPFARHSPSLVDNVTRGVSTILNQYARLAGIRSTIRNAIGALAAFNAATGTAMQGAQLGEYQQQKTEITAIAPGSGAEIDALINSIFEMEDALSQVGAEISIQSAYVDDWRRSIEAAMAPINQAITDNEMAQKKLRLEMLRMEEAGETIDGVRDRLAKLNGEIENMRAERTDLRMAGAGGDVLGFYDDQIAALEQQRDSLEGYADPLSELQKQLDELARQGEILQLERDIQFDPQIAALEAEEDKLRELQDAYSDIKSAISDMEGALRSSAAAAKELAAAAEVPFAVEQFQNAAGSDFPTFEGDTIPGLGREGDLADIEAFNAELEAQLQEQMDALGAMDFFKPFKDMFKSAWNWIKDNVGPYVMPVVGALQSWFNSVDWGTLFGNIRAAWDNLWAGFTGEGGGQLGGILASIGGFVTTVIDALRQVWDFVINILGPVWDWLYETVSGAIASIGGELQNWIPLLDPLMEAIGHVVHAFQVVLLPVIGVVLGAIMLAWKTFWPVLRNILTPIIDAIVGVVRGGLEILRGVFGFVLNLINGDWGAAWRSLLTLVDGIWDAIYSVIKLPIDLIIGIVSGLIEGIIAAWDWLYETLVGHSIIPDMMNAIVGWFEFLVAPIRVVWEAIWGAIKWAWDAIQAIWDDLKLYWIMNIQPKIELMQAVFSNVWDGIVNAVSGAWDRLKPILESVASFVANTFNTIWDTFKSTTETVWNGLKSVIGAALRPVGNLVAGFLRVIANVAGAVGLGGIESTLRSAADGADGWGEGFARGGVMNHKDLRPFKTNGPMAIVGEGKSSYPEYVIPTDPAHKRRAQSLWAAAGGDLQMFGIGGIIGGAFDAVTSGFGALGGAINWAADQVEEVVREAAAGVLKHAWPQLMNMSPFSGWDTDQMKTMFPMGHDALRSRTIEMIEGGAAAEVARIDAPITRAEEFARGQAGKPYVWGAVGPNGYDCSGFMSAIANVLASDAQFTRPYQRLFTTGSIFGTNGVGGFVRDLNSGFRIGVNHKYGQGHTAGTLFLPDGSQLNVEATPDHVRVGGNAHGWGYGTQKFGFPVRGLARGGILAGDTGLLKKGMSIPALLSGGGKGLITNLGDALAMSAPGLFNGALVKGSQDGSLVRVGDRNRDELIQPLPKQYTDSGNREYHFYGDLEFPNVKSGEDAGEFLRNLETLVGD